MKLEAVFRKPFLEQILFFRGKLKELIPTQKWNEVWKQQHDRAFMIAGAVKADLLADLAKAVEKAIAEGKSIHDFRKEFDEIVAKHGWQGWRGEKTKTGRAWRTRIIYTTNARVAYSAGRLAQLQNFEYWIYKHGNSEHPRLQHLAWDGLTLPKDHPFWRTHYPPNGFGCKCRVVGAGSLETAKLLGGGEKTEPPKGWDTIDPKTKAPVGIDKGWDYMPGLSTIETFRSLADKIKKLPEPLRNALLKLWIDKGLINPPQE
ncbi:MAG: phage minor head protein [Fervidobacterium sp.]|nr:phage minor head protein [Fervidobacterium sp.]